MSHRRRRWLRRSSRHRPAFGLEWPLEEMGEATGGVGSIWLNCFIPHVLGWMNGREVDPRSQLMGKSSDQVQDCSSSLPPPHSHLFIHYTKRGLGLPASQSIRMHAHCHPARICILSLVVGVISIPWHQPNSSGAPDPSAVLSVRTSEKYTLGR